MSEKLYTIKVIPNSKLTKIIEKKNDFLKIKIAQPAYQGKANKALISLLSQEFKVAKNKISIISGEKAATKKISVQQN